MTALLDVGPPLPVPRPPTAREAWQAKRAEVIAEQGGKCFVCNLPFERLEVIETTEEQLVALCRGDRVRMQASQREGRRSPRQREVRGTRKKRGSPVRAAEKNWSQGYACALANVHRHMRNGVAVQQALIGAGLSLLGLIKAGVEEHDASELLSAIKTSTSADSGARGATVQHLRRLIARLP